MQKKYDVTYLKVYGNLKIQIVNCNVVTEFEEDKIYTEKGSVNDEKLLDNIYRARKAVLGYALCNPFEWFCTFTINSDKHNRYDLNSYHKKLTQFFRDYNKKYGTNIKYLTVPEQHKDGAWHEHGFIMGLPSDHLTKFKRTDNIPQKLKNRLSNGVDVRYWQAYQNAFGWCDFEPIGSQERCARYVTKYISKDIACSITDVNAHLYYCSKGLDKPCTVKKGCLSTVPGLTDNLFTYKNDFCRIGWLDYSDEVLEQLKNAII